MRLSLTEMEPEHLTAVAGLEATVQQVPWSAAMFTGELGRDDRRYVTAWTGGGATLTGFGGVLMSLEDAHITTIVVDPTQRRRGVARQILRRLLCNAVDMGATAATLEVRASNVAAQRLYQGFGFAPVGIRPGYYPGSREDAIIMWVHDIDSPAYLAHHDPVSSVSRTGVARCW